MNNTLNIAEYSLLDYSLKLQEAVEKGNRRTVTGIYTGPALYVAGGDPISANDVGLSDIRELDFGLAADANGANPRLLRLNAAGTKIMWYNPQTAAELVANAVLNGLS